MNFYEVLGVDRHSSQHQIKRAYRQKALQYHPDRNPDNVNQATRMFRQVQEAYDHLSDLKKRQVYDINFMSYGNRQNQAEGDLNEDDSIFDAININFSGYEEASKFESKDGILALFLVFVGHLNFEAVVGLSKDLKLWALAFVGGSLVSGLIIKALGKLLHVRFGVQVTEGFKEIVFYNSLMAIWLAFCCSRLEGTHLSNLVLTPLAPSLFAALLAGLLGAAFGRAFAASGSAIVGMVGGAFTSFVVAGFLGVWVVFLQIAASATELQVAAGSKQAMLVLLIGSISASVLGSITMRDLFIYNILDWFEYFFDRFRPRAKTRELQI